MCVCIRFPDTFVCSLHQNWKQRLSKETVVLPLKALIKAALDSTSAGTLYQMVKKRTVKSHWYILVFQMSLLAFFFFWDRAMLCSPGKLGAPCVYLTGFEPMSFLLFQLLNCWHCKCTPPCLASVLKWDYNFFLTYSFFNL